MRRDIPSLDGIRAVAVSVVFLSHIGLGQIVPGGFGVTIFFFLSGFLITTLLLREYAHNGQVAIGAFFGRRFLRLTPPLLVTLAAIYAGVLAGLLPGELNVASALSQFLYFFNYFEYFAPPDLVKIPDGSEVLWSLSVEEHFYMGFVLLFAAISRYLSVRCQIAVLVAICVAALVWRSILVFGFDAGLDRIFKTTDTRLDSILIGSVLAYLTHFGHSRRLFGLSTRQLWLWVPGALAVLLFCFVWRNPEFRYTGRYTVQGLALMPLFYFAVYRADHWMFRPLNARAMIYFGQVSYTFYLCHLVIIRALETYVLGERLTLASSPVAIIGVAIVAGGLSLAFSAAVFHGVEAKVARLRHRLKRVPDVEPGSEPKSELSQASLKARPAQAL